MPKMIPELEPAKISNEGERVLYEALCEQLPDDWVVRYHYSICVRQGEHFRECEVDFIVLAPGKGLMVLECKGNIGWECQSGQWYQLTKTLQRKSTENPFWRFTLKRGPHRIGDLRRKGTHFSKLG